jgi:hypothetical protein
VDLALVLQRLYNSEINVTITWLWDGGFDLALISYISPSSPTWNGKKLGSRLTT